MAAERPRRLAVVVEDEPDIRSLAATLLEESGLEVVEVETADEGLAYLGKHADEVAVLFTDVVMHGNLTGTDLAQVVAHNWPWIRVLVTSGYEPSAALPETAVYVQKPWRALDILVQVDRAARLASG
jgi:DNA-binding NtrC family response regulator